MHIKIGLSDLFDLPNQVRVRKTKLMYYVASRSLKYNYSVSKSVMPLMFKLAANVLLEFDSFHVCTGCPKKGSPLEITLSLLLYIWEFK